MKRPLLHRQDTWKGHSEDSLTARATGEGIHEFRFVTFKPNFFEIDFNLSSAGTFVLMQNNYPRWKLYINGIAAPIEEAYSTFMRFQVPKGKHIVQFKYEAREIKFAFLMSSILLIGLLVYGITRSRFSKKIPGSLPDFNQ
jgi:uncharacterized membrane protein YfhO